jgi:hypothetical protein
MTGFARAEGEADGISWVWELKSVNSRSLDLRLRLPPGFDPLEAQLRASLARRCRRGNIASSVSVNRLVPQAICINRAVLVPSQRLPWIAADWVQVLETSDIPAGVVNLVTGHREELAPVLAAHGDVDALWCHDAVPELAKKLEELSAMLAAQRAELASLVGRPRVARRPSRR